MGYPNANILSMLKHGETKLPLDKVPVVAAVLEIDPAHLFRLGVQQIWSQYQEVISEVFGTVVTTNEVSLLTALRQATGDRDPAFSVEKIVAAVGLLTDV